MAALLFGCAETYPVRDHVLLLHGIARRAASMNKMARALQKAGFETLNLDYPSRHHPIDALADYVHQQVNAAAPSQQGRLHIVTHSMGGLVARAFIKRYRPSHLGRVVMLGPPNQGSEIADLVGHSWAYRRFFGPSGAQLMTNVDEDTRALYGSVDYPLGVIAGCRSVDPICWIVIPGPNDGKVSVASTHLEGEADHIVLPATHSLIPSNRGAAQMAIRFLKQGCF